MTIDRRRFLTGTAGMAAVALVPLGCRSVLSGPALAFRHGVASGDPLADRVILWTRVSPPPGVAEVEVRWEVATAPDFREIAAQETTDVTYLNDEIKVIDKLVSILKELNVL